MVHMNPQNESTVYVWLNARGVALRCCVCGSNDWTLRPRTVDPGFVAVICRNCAGVTLLDAEAMGIVTAGQ